MGQLTQKTYGHGQAQPASAPVNARQLADIVLYSLQVKGATAVWIEPQAGDDDPDTHCLTVEKRRKSVASAILRGGLGDATLARLAILAGVDLLAPGTNHGRIRVAVDARELELLFTLRHTDTGLAGELRVLGSEADEVELGQGTVVDLPEVLEVGTDVGPYVIKQYLGRGGMGIVYRVEHTLLRKSFAMKVLSKNVLEGDPDSARRFVREARAAARVKHDGIVDVSDFGTLSDGRHYLVMELLSGRCLDDVMDSQGAMAPLPALKLLREVASALAAAHSAGIVHRDISPSNIFIDKDDDGEPRVKVVDFGAASVPDRDQADVPDGPPGMVVGTPYYMPPEQAQALPTDHRSDMYALGTVLYELVSGRVPFEGESPRDIVMKHILEEVPPLYSDHHEEVPEELWLVIKRMMAKRMEERFPNTEAVVAEFDRLINTLGRTGWRRWLPT